MVMEQSRDDRVMSLLDSFLEGREEKVSAVDELISVPMDYVSAYLDTPSKTDENGAESAIRSKTEQLLDTFLASDYRKPEFVIETDETAPESSADEAQDDAKELDDAYFTETLARIYLCLLYTSDAADE